MLQLACLGSRARHERIVLAANAIDDSVLEWDNCNQVSGTCWAKCPFSQSECFELNPCVLSRATSTFCWTTCVHISNSFARGKCVSHLLFCAVVHFHRCKSCDKKERKCSCEMISNDHSIAICTWWWWPPKNTWRRSTADWLSVSPMANKNSCGARSWQSCFPDHQESLTFAKMKFPLETFCLFCCSVGWSHHNLTGLSANCKSHMNDWHFMVELDHHQLCLLHNISDFNWSNFGSKSGHWLEQWTSDDANTFCWTEKLPKENECQLQKVGSLLIEIQNVGFWTIDRQCHNEEGHETCFHSNTMCFGFLCTFNNLTLSRELFLETCSMCSFFCDLVHFFIFAGAADKCLDLMVQIMVCLSCKSVFCMRETLTDFTQHLTATFFEMSTSENCEQNWDPQLHWSFWVHLEIIHFLTHMAFSDQSLLQQSQSGCSACDASTLQLLLAAQANSYKHWFCLLAL